MIPIRKMLFKLWEKLVGRSPTPEELKDATHEYVEEMHERYATMSDEQFRRWLEK